MLEVELTRQRGPVTTGSGRNGLDLEKMSSKVTYAYFDTGYVLSDLLHRRTRSAHVYNGCLTLYDVLLIPRITQESNTVNNCLSCLHFTAEWIRGVDTALYHVRHPL